MSRRSLLPNKRPSLSNPSRRLALKSTLLGLSGAALASMLPAQLAFASTDKKSIRTTSSSDVPIAASHWDETLYQQILARIQAPIFANRTFKITDFGAKTGQDCTQAIHDAISHCHQAGGGRVIIPAGLFYSGAIHLQSRVELHLSAQAIIKFSTNPKDYPLVLTRFEGTECMNYSPLIYAYQQHDVAVTGKGTLDGQASTSNWWAWKNTTQPKPYQQSPDSNKLIEMADNNVPVSQRVFGLGHYLRPCFIEPHSCNNVLIEGVTIKNSPMWEIHPTLSKNVTIRDVTIQSYGPNNDGCDPESCSDVLIEGCQFNTGDDCIAIKSGKNHDGRRVHTPSQNIIIRHCKMLDGHGGIVFGSECSGHIFNVFAHDCDMSSPHLQRALRFKDNAMRGGHVENIYLRNSHVGFVEEAFLTIDLLYGEGSHGDFMPVIKNVNISGITSDNSPRVMFIVSFKGAVLDQIHFNQCEFNNTEHSDIIDVSGEITLTNVKVTPKAKVEALGHI
ncbi:glycoside hydrolase family 28 protein [Celerinatantimonas yamalensis]|uniref:Glycoside hydrolase family 28 protein n=1 Tax=Celerinatantimonas yamalensis TaxID=559956 RepID=A0ABW9G7U3_9GAMM